MDQQKGENVQRDLDYFMFNLHESLMARTGINFVTPVFAVDCTLEPKYLDMNYTLRQH